MIIGAMIVWQVQSANMLSDELSPMLSDEISAQLKSLTKKHAELIALGDIFQECVSHSCALQANLSTDVKDLKTFIETSAQEGDLCFFDLRSAFLIVEKEWGCASVYAASQVFRYRKIDWSHAEDVRMNLQKIFIRFEELAEMQSEAISALQLRLVQRYAPDAKNDPVEQVLQALLFEGHHVSGDMSLKAWMTSILNKYRAYVENRNSKMRDYANKFGVDRSITSAMQN